MPLVKTQRLSNAALYTGYKESLRDGVSPDYLRHARDFLAWLKDRPLDARSVADYINGHREAGWSDGYARLQWGTIRRLFIANGVPWPFRHGEAPRVREREEDRRAMTASQVIKLIEASKTMKPDYYPCFMALSTTYGLRRTEMAAMRPANLRNGLVYVETAKHGRERFHSCPSHIYAWIQKWGFRESVSVSYLSKLFVNIRDEAGFTGPGFVGIGPHSIRRTLALRLEEAGLSDRARRSFLRWKSSGFGGNMAERYSAAQIVGEDGRVAEELSASDEEIDQRVFAAHPFLEAWK